MWCIRVPNWFSSLESCHSLMHDGRYNRLCLYQPPSEARGLRYLKNTFVTRMITWAQNVKSAPVGGSAPRRLSVCLSVCPSVCPLLTVLVWNRWTIQAEIFRGPSGQVQARIFLKSARSVEIRPSYRQTIAENLFCPMAQLVARPNRNKFGYVLKTTKMGYGHLLGPPQGLGHSWQVLRPLYHGC